MKQGLWFLTLIFFYQSAFTIIGRRPELWIMPDNIPYKGVCKVNCAASQIDLEVGLFALKNCEFYFKENNSLIEEFFDLLQAREVYYVDYEENIPISKNAISHMHVMQEPAAIDILKSDGTHFLPDIQQYTPSIVCLKVDIGFADAVEALKQWGYRLFSNFNNKCLVFVRDENLQAKDTNNDARANAIVVIEEELEQMMLHPIEVDGFNKEPVPTEKAIYECLKNRPLVAPVNFVAFPWTLHLNKKLSLNSIKNRRFTGGFTICQHVYYDRIVPFLKRLGLDVLFTPHADKIYYGFIVKGIPHYPINGTEPRAKKDLWYSFIGYKTHQVRDTIFQMPCKENCLIKQRKHWHFAPNTFNPGIMTAQEQLRQKKEYQDALARSRFSLCPRGVGSSTIRPWESMQAGAIPVLISDDMILPDGIDWSSCLVRVKEKDVLKIPEILTQITLEQEEQMRENAIGAFMRFSGHNFDYFIRYYYDYKENQ